MVECVDSAGDYICAGCIEREELREEIRKLQETVGVLVELVKGRQAVRPVCVCVSTQTESVLVDTGSQAGTGHEGAVMAGWTAVSGRKAYAKVVQEGVVATENRFSALGADGVASGADVRDETVVVGDSTIRHVDKVVCREVSGKCVRVCLPGAKIQDVIDRVGTVMGSGTGGSAIVHIGTNNVEKEGSEVIMGRYRALIRELKEKRVGQIVLSGILPVRGNYRNSRRVSINYRLQKLCQEEGVGYVSMWDRFYGRAELYLSDGLHLSSKGAAVLGKGFVRVLGDGVGIISNLN